MKAFQFLIIVSILFLIAGCSNKPSAGEQVLIKEGFSHKVVDSYWLYLPANYDKSKKWPLIMFLQGGDAAAGPNPYTVKNGGPISYIFDQKKRFLILL